MVRNGSRVDLGTFLKDFGSSSVTSVNDNVPFIMDGGWRLCKISSFTNCPTYGNVANESLGLLPHKYGQRKVTVLLDGYARSTKDHEHQLRSGV